MREFFDRLNIRIGEFMEGRNGIDDLNKFLLIIAIIVVAIQLFIPHPLISAVGWVFIIVALIRALSRNLSARQRSNDRFLKIIKGPKAWGSRMKKRKTTLYFKCSDCKTRLSVPRGKGKIRIICPNCGKEIFKTT